MEWQTLETTGNLWFLWGWILFWPVAFFINILCGSNSQPPFGLGVGIIVLIFCAIPGSISTTKAKAIQKEMGFTTREAYARQIKFES
jgi:hypothetical protein